MGITGVNDCMIDEHPRQDCSRAPGVNCCKMSITDKVEKLLLVCNSVCVPLCINDPLYWILQRVRETTFKSSRHVLTLEVE